MVKKIIKEYFFVLKIKGKAVYIFLELCDLRELDLCISNLKLPLEIK
jgi:hypothetical protein